MYNEYVESITYLRQNYVASLMLVRQETAKTQQCVRIAIKQKFGYHHTKQQYKLRTPKICLQTYIYIKFHTEREISWTTNWQK